MTITDSCKQISENLAHNLRLAKSNEQKLEYLSLALMEFGEKVVPALNELVSTSAKESQDLVAARTAALEFVTVVAGSMVRKSTHYRGEIFTLEEVSDKCIEPQLKAKLLFYTNQLKKRWLKVEPGGLAHNPRAKKLRAEEQSGNPVVNVVGGLLLLVFFIYLLSQLQPNMLIFPALENRPKAEPISLSRTDREQATPAQPSVSVPPALPVAESPQAAIPPSAGAIYSYTDRQGVVHMVDNLDRVPVKYRKNMKVDESVPTVVNSTPVIIDGNQVIVPVTITFRGRSVKTRLLLDTGATLTSISENIASQLGVSGTDVKEGKSTVADGRSVRSFRFKADSLAVASHVLPNADTSILPGAGGKGYDGLLGMNFLRNFRYHVNFNRSVIEWGG